MRSLYLAITLAALVTISGCISPYQTDDNGTESAPPAEPEPVPRSASTGFECDVSSTSLTLGGQPVCGVEEVVLPATVFHLSIEASWENEQASYSIHAEDPDGTEHVSSSGSGTSHALEIDEPIAGTYSYWVELNSLPLSDHVEITATYFWMELADANAPDAPSPVRVERDGNNWIARITYRAQGTTGAAADIKVATVNGDVEITHVDAGTSNVVAEAWGRAASEARARELVLALKVSLSIREGDVRATVDHQQANTGDREGVGADIELATPATLSGNADTTNGDVEFGGNVPLSDLDASTTNGDVSGSVRPAKAFEGHTTNGDVDLSIEPTGNVALKLRSTNGDITLDLLESSDIGYKLTASNTNGAISESMSEAALTGTDHSKTLETEGFSGRTISVTGSTSTTNGSIQFDGR